MDEELLAKGKEVTQQFLDLVLIEDKDLDNNPATWKSNKQSDGIVISSRKSSLFSGLIYKSEVELDASPEKMLALLSPILPYRVQWDPLLDSIRTVKDFGQNTYLIYHATKPTLKVVSARDSIDVVSIGETDQMYYVAAASVQHPEFPVTKEMVRALQYPAGYAIFKIPGNPNRCKWVMILHADIKMNSVGSFMVDMVKPQLMCNKVNGLLSKLDKLVVDPDDIVKSGDLTKPSKV